jgi:hypothetical protein
MERIPVQSSDLTSVGYDVDSQLLEVEFHSGAVYDYARVPASVHHGLMSAGSKGRYFNQFVRKAGYVCRRIH